MTCALPTRLASGANTDMMVSDMTDTNQLPPHTITIHDHPEPHIMQWSDLELAAVKRYAEQYALQARAQVQGDPSWWMRDTDEGAEWTDTAPLVLSGWTPLYTTPQPAQATQAEVTDDFLYELWDQKYRSWIGGEQFEQIARAILALRPERVPMTERELELIDGMIAVQLDHAQRCDAISNRAMAEKQKGWDMERVELLRRIRSFGITAQAKKEAP